MDRIDKNDINIFKSMAGVVIINKDEKVIFMGEDLLSELSLTKEQAIGKKIIDIIPTTKMHHVLKTGKKQIGTMYFVEGYTVVSNAYPVYDGEDLVGAVEIDVFSNAAEVEEFLDEVNSLPSIEPKIIKNIKSNKSKYAKYSMEDIRGSSQKNKQLKEDITFASRSNSTLLLTGETGCGKELVAHAVHKLGQRSLFNFVRLNCAAIPSELFESEMFGYEEGSFTGATKEGKKGKVEIANNGTLFLDEIDSLPLHMQAKLLRFLQEKEICRIGAEYTIPINTRVIAATNHNMLELVREKKIRNDLFYRLNVLEINVPPLRERLEDIPEIVEGVVGRLNVELDKSAYKITSIDDRIYPLLMSYDWPGNIRELSNIIERAMSKSYSHDLKLEHFEEVMSSLIKGNISSDATIDMKSQTIRSIKEEAEKNLIIYSLYNSNGDLKKAAELTGISLQMLYRKLKSLNIKH